jgi:hypothetical protein
MQSTLVAINMNLMNLARKATAEKNPLIVELARETHSLCEVVQKMERMLSSRDGTEPLRSA